MADVVAITMPDGSEHVLPTTGYCRECGEEMLWGICTNLGCSGMHPDDFTKMCERLISLQNPSQ